jgi:hypothetical protein
LVDDQSNDGNDDNDDSENDDDEDVLDADGIEKPSSDKGGIEVKKRGQPARSGQTRNILSEKAYVCIILAWYDLMVYSGGGKSKRR